MAINSDSLPSTRDEALDFVVSQLRDELREDWTNMHAHAAIKAARNGNVNREVINYVGGKRYNAGWQSALKWEAVGRILNV